METFLQSATHVVFLASIDDKTAMINNDIKVTLEYLITVQHLLNVHNGKTRFHMACKEGQFDVVELQVQDFLVSI